MNDCIFCKIIAGEIPCHKVYEDDLVLAFLDIHPINLGHVLVIPKEHHPNFHQVPEPFYTAIFYAAKKIATSIEIKLKPKRVGLMIAGWDVAHTHIHVVPMNDYHDLTSKRFMEDEKLNPTSEELQEVAEKISKNL